MTNEHLAVDVAIVGAGPAGLAAAQAVAKSGRTVAIVDDNPRAGGQIWRQGPDVAPSAPARASLDVLRQPNVRHLAATRVVAAPRAGALLLEDAEHGLLLDYRKLILCCGARELLLPFPGWTLPGATGAGGLQALIKGGMPVRGERVVIAGSGPLLIASLATARAAGAKVVAVVEQARLAALAHFALSLAATPSKLAQAARLTRGFAGTRYLTGAVVREAHGDARVRAVTIERNGARETIDCDRVACGFGLVPNLTLALALGCAVRDRAIAIEDAQRTSVEHVYAAGECTGVGGVELARIEGELAGLAASGADATPDGRARFAALLRRRATWRRFAARVADTFALREAARALPPDDTLLCRCEDVTIGAVRAHASARDAKLQTRCGMGACQGRVCGAAAHAYFGWDDTPPRPPFSPARIDTLLVATDDALL
ncbi:MULTISPECIES: NAD(P)/FAD-dependent oxidoreductase [pseudomallei group]|uniref:NAD(P)/FAD-dependent oxidoreductase n=1 Tax=pseudomallei group TaxID=111527 RepID=UPI0005D97F59|nr:MULTISPECIES: FAD/NAD(P)-binding oxidoreductase [pseudomallei group]AJX35521.1 FAD dependent oxidoreductase family protein [Burkholderia oklahomensis C6786]AOI49727.1 FAD/NAD(P)-binding oxidoreductase [Burkholderia oklahomensis C6786]ARK46229.1 FAD/NAD(P)-binding oxidoreductase [Burkholderia pseudomallei]ARK56219.1 FAD/NAD(P)-binding oxidoreductase [Burkholderia pseudomallei]KUY51830.1 FAD/NAD(P)-binding oxidoreductase [Burkholderia oklahomensis C6786]